MARTQVESAFVDKVLIGNDGAFGLRTSEPHSRKNDSGGFDTTGRTFRTIRGRGIDWSQFQERDRIAFFGREETVEREHDGKKYYDLIVWVDAVSKVASKGQSNQGAANSFTPASQQQQFNAPNDQGWPGSIQQGAPTTDSWAAAKPYGDDTPF